MGLSPDQAFAFGLVRDSRGNWVKAAKLDTVNAPDSGVDLESKLHEQIWNYCNAKGWAVYHSRMDKKTTCAEGTPDFIIFMEGPKTAVVEAKARKEKPKPKQLGWEKHLKMLGHHHAFVWNFEQFLEFIGRVVDSR